ncbi:MAG: c-type cytochrome [Opitutaceae bacterium]
MPKSLRRKLAPGFAIAFVLTGGCSRNASLVDDAGGRDPEEFPELAVDVFKAMDGGIALTEDEIKGRNTWNLWTGGNEQFWERMSRESYGLIDLLKVIDSRKRPERFETMGVISQPGYRQASQPDEHGLWIDEAVEPESAAIDPEVYGRATGIMGYRLFPNPAFDEEAKAKWDGERFYDDPDYAVDPGLIRPYRVGVSCGSCHIAFNPLNPPADVDSPRWENLMSAIGNQYIREGVAFAGNVKEGGLFWEMLKTQPPGTSDTSRIATDHINNPNAINPIFLLGRRLAAGHDEEITSDETLRMPAVEDPMKVPMVLKDGADSVGVPGATLRVYINIGMYSQHWLQQHNALIGLGGQKPFEISTAQENSVYWRATETKFENIAKFFMRLEPLKLADAPRGERHLTDDAEELNRGKRVFAQNCAGCHSSKRPPEGVEGDAAKAWFAEAIMRDDFLEGNFLADERRHSVKKIGTNAARAFATNAMRGHIWENFSSETYKQLPSIGEIEVYNPYTDRMQKFKAPAGGPGYYRTPALVSIWTSAPFFHNNALGKFTGDPSVEGRMEAFNDAVEKLLWPEKRLGRDSIWRTTQEANLQIQAAVIPKALRLVLQSQIDDDGYLRIGPIPEGTPVNLLANISPESDPKQLLQLCIRIKRVLAEIKLKGLDSAGSKALMKAELAPLLFEASKCPDLVTDRGHTFGSDLPDRDKRALIEYLKTF